MELWHCFIDIFGVNRLYFPEGEKSKQNCRYPTQVTSEFSSKKQIIIIIMSTLKTGKNVVYV